MPEANLWVLRHLPEIASEWFNGEGEYLRHAHRLSAKADVPFHEWLKAKQSAQRELGITSAFDFACILSQ